MRGFCAIAAIAVVAGCAQGSRERAPIPNDLRSVAGPGGYNARAVIDEARQEVIVWAGPFRVEPTAGGHAHGPAAPAAGGAPGHAAGIETAQGEESGHGDAGHHDEEHGDTKDEWSGHDDRSGTDDAPPGHAGHSRSPVIPIAWPADGYIRGFALELRDGDGNPLPRSLMHHLIAVNFDRRMFAYPVAERLFGIGTETGDQELPATVGVPLEKGQNLGFYVMWDNATGETIEEVYIRLAMPWTPAEKADDIVEVMPLYVDVNNQIGFTNAFDLEPGRSERSWEFQPPVPGRLLLASGHLHDFGKVVRLEDAETGEVLLEIRGDLDEKGLIHGIERRVMGIWHGGLRLETDRRYRVVGVYDSPLSETVPMGAMAHIVGIFAPDDLDAWPEAEPASEIWALDLTGLPAQSQVMVQARDALRSEGGGR